MVIGIAALVLALAAVGAWRGSGGLPGSTRSILLGLRLLAVAAAALLLLNPGKWIRPKSETPRPWIVLIDRSASMAQSDSGGGTRATTAAAMAGTAEKQAKELGLPLRVHPFAASLSAATSADSLPAATGDGSRILPALSQTLLDSSSAGESPAGIILLSDGRQTAEFSQADLDSLALRARSRNVPVHTVPIGADSPSPDLVLSQPRAAVTAFPSQPLRIPISIRSEAMAPARPVVTLRDAAGGEIASLTLEVATGKTVTAVFETKAPAASERWTIETPVIDGEARPSNNSAGVNIRILDSKTRVFIVEGSPYWDSKFLAQLLRQQPHMDVRSIHRLSDQRYFRIDSGTAGSSEIQEAVFPATLEELRRYDLIVFGKNIDPFITPERAAALRSYVRDHGGAVLFARGKPTSAPVAEIEPLEPVEWGTATSADFRFTPTRDGGAAGLFGQALPAPDASLWASLPTLKDGRQISLVKPFTRVLAEGLPEGAGKSGRFPALLVRRYGQGVTGMVNGDGLWKWDFFPEARELGNCYEDFWTQLIQWMSSYSEFLPGQDFSMRLPSLRGDAGVTTAASISFRGASAAPQPMLAVTNPTGTESRFQPAAIPDPSGRPSWRASFTPDAPGNWKLKLIDPRKDAPATPEVLFTVPPAPAEKDDLSADPELLTSIARATGGVCVPAGEFSGFLKSKLAPETPAARESGAVWQPSWNHALIAITIAVLFSIEWFIRRRNGLA